MQWPRPPDQNQRKRFRQRAHQQRPWLSKKPPTFKPGVRLGAPDAAPAPLAPSAPDLVEPIPVWPAADLESGLLVDDPRPIAQFPVPTPKLGARRTRYIVDPE